MNVRKRSPEHPVLPKVPSGIKGLDEITEGGLPRGRPTLVCGSAGSGKTLFCVQFLVNGAMHYGDPGVFVSFEERADELATNAASLGFDLGQLQKDELIRVDHVQVRRHEIEETGEYDLEGLFVRLSHAIDSIGAKRIVLDTLESLFAGLDNASILRAELRRLFAWLKDRGLTAIITGEKGEGRLTRQGLEEYVSDCVILLDHRVENKISTRLLRIVKYRGSMHGTNEYPFLIDEEGLSILPITSLNLENKVSSDRVSSGVSGLDKMLGGEGFYRGSSILVSGTAGTGKTSIAGSFANQVCLNGEKCLYFSFEESPQQIVRNMKSIGIDLQKHLDDGLLKFSASRPTLHGLEMHLINFHRQVNEFKPSAVVLDPITNLGTVGAPSEVKSLLIRLIDFLQGADITLMLTALALRNGDQTDKHASSLVDTWIMVRDIESNGERNRGLYVMKSRGMSHSNQIREFVISENGLRLVDIYIGPDGVLTGSARHAQQLRDESGGLLRDHAVSRKDREIERKKKVLESRIARLREEFDSVREELNKSYIEEKIRQEVMERNRMEMARNRSKLD